MSPETDYGGTLGRSEVTTAVVPAAASKPAGVSDSELKQVINRLVAGGDLNTLTKRAVREQLQAAYPSVDLLARKDLVMGEIENAVKNRLAGGM